MSDTTHDRSTPHGVDKHLEPEDPMQRNGQVVPGDPAVMLDGLVEEFARMGMPRDRILNLFESPTFEATHGLRAVLGADVVRRRVDAVLQRCGVWNITVHEVAPTQPCGASGDHSHNPDHRHNPDHGYDARERRDHA